MTATINKKNMINNKSNSVYDGAYIKSSTMVMTVKLHEQKSMSEKKARID